MSKASGWLRSRPARANASRKHQRLSVAKEMRYVHKTNSFNSTVGFVASCNRPLAFADQTSQPNDQSSIAVVKQTPEQLQQLVAPIALYPDELVAEVLAAATYPTQVVEADRLLAVSDSVDVEPGSLVF